MVLSQSRCYQYRKLSISNDIFLTPCKLRKKDHSFIAHCTIKCRKTASFDMACALSPLWPPTFTVCSTCLACNQQLSVCREVADGSRRDVLTAVITLWIVTADRGHNKTIVAAILEKVLNRGDMRSEGYTSLLNLIINSNRTRDQPANGRSRHRKELGQHKDYLPI